MIFTLLGGIMVAAGVFAALLWSVFRAITARGRLQHIHIALAVLTFAGMATVSMVSVLASQFAGALLAISAIAGIIAEHRWNKILPVFQLAFAIALFMGLPFVAA